MAEIDTSMSRNYYSCAEFLAKLCAVSEIQDSPKCCESCHDDYLDGLADLPEVRMAGVSYDVCCHIAQWARLKAEDKGSVYRRVPDEQAIRNSICV